ncbi:hypothetical protein [Actinomadura sp. KC216]|uniref:hypothetical protein n=1 Tax=Actinomadura sp. KC216 TaxID=2530370 RepID=UPI001404E965|nr:hypothetical protein [Actinomadura sp. KC216]
MSKNLLSLAILIAVVSAVVLLFVKDITLPVALSVGAGALCLAWLVLLLTVPWNVYFQALAVLEEIRVSRDRGLDVPKGSDDEARRIAARMRAAAVGAHVLTAALVAAVTYFSGADIGYYFAAFYLVSTSFRPAGAWFAHLRRRLNTMLKDVRFPRDDVVDLAERITFLEVQAENLRATAEQLHSADLAAERSLEDLSGVTSRRDGELDRRLDAMGRQFEETVARLTDNQEVIAGIKAFLRMLRTETA